MVENYVGNLSKLYQTESRAAVYSNQSDSIFSLFSKALEMNEADWLPWSAASDSDCFNVDKFPL